MNQCAGGHTVGYAGAKLEMLGQTHTTTMQSFVDKARIAVVMNMFFPTFY